MMVDEVLTFTGGPGGPLRSPVMLIALSGLFDMASVATTTVNRFAPADRALTVARIDPDPFYDFTQHRPEIAIHGGTSTIRWPENRFDLVRDRGGRDLIILVGVEPDLAWATYAGAIATVAQHLGCGAVVTVGSAAEAVPHTRTPLVTGSTTDATLARRLGIGQPTYEGITGVIGVLHADLDRRGIPAVSLRVGVPHYLLDAEHPQAVAALQRHLSHVLGVPVADDGGQLAAAIEHWATRYAQRVADDPHLGVYAHMLEEGYDRRTEASIPSPDDLGAAFEDFLRSQNPDT